MQRLAAWTRQTPERSSRVGTAIDLFFTLCVFGFLVAHSDLVERHVPAAAGASVAAFLFVVFLKAAFQAAMDEGRSPTAGDESASRGPLRLLRTAFRGLIHVIAAIMTLNLALIVVLLVLVTIATGQRWLEAIPQEFGGVRPRCAHLDLQASSLSAPMRRALAGPSAEAAAGIVRSARLEIFSIDPWLARLPACPDDTLRQPCERVVQLDRDAVRSAAWVRCDAELAR